MYSKILRDDLYDYDIPIWNPTLVNHIGNELHAGTYEYTEKDVLALPPPIRHLHFLWRAQCDIGGSGFEGYLSQAFAYEIKGVYEALIEVNAKQLSRLMCKAIALAQNELCEFNDEIEKSHLEKWFNQFTHTGIYTSSKNIDLRENSYELTHKYLESYIIQYVNDNIDSIAR